MTAGHGVLHAVPRPGAAAPTMLGVWAHPDDEAYLSAGLTVMALAAGWRVVVATATRGELGSTEVPAEHLGVLRQREIAASLGILGVDDHRWLRGTRPLVDGGLADVPEHEGADMVAALLDDVRPDLVVTFGPDGLTGHSDHRAVSRWTARAWQRAGTDADLWYAALTSDFLDRWGALCADAGVWMDGGPPEPVRAADLVHVQACSGALLDQKYAALAAHGSQTAALIASVGERTYREWWSTESFVSARATAAVLEEVA
jgi:LmbE family N-acetylglucosaminyl deacetylase